MQYMRDELQEYLSNFRYRPYIWTVSFRHEKV